MKQFNFMKQIQNQFVPYSIMTVQIFILNFLGFNNKGSWPFFRLRFACVPNMNLQPSLLTAVT
jgi:hypothetical protein